MGSLVPTPPGVVGKDIEAIAKDDGRKIPIYFLEKENSKSDQLMPLIVAFHWGMYVCMYVCTYVYVCMHACRVMLSLLCYVCMYKPKQKQKREEQTFCLINYLYLRRKKKKKTHHHHQQQQQQQQKNKNAKQHTTLGGMVMGDHHDPLMYEFVQNADAKVASVGYRLFVMPLFFFSLCYFCCYCCSYCCCCFCCCCSCGCCCCYCFSVYLL